MRSRNQNLEDYCTSSASGREHAEDQHTRIIVWCTWTKGSITLDEEVGISVVGQHSKVWYRVRKEENVRVGKDDIVPFLHKIGCEEWLAADNVFVGLGVTEGRGISGLSANFDG